MVQPVLSVIVPTFNRCELLRTTIDALLRSDVPLEIIVVDGGSKDGTVRLLEAHGDRVRWISEQDKGEHWARNKALRMTSCDFIHFAGDDNEIRPEGFRQALDYFRQHPETDLLFGWAGQYFEDLYGNRLLMNSRHSGDRTLHARHFIRGEQPNVMSDTAIFRKSVVDRIGNFDVKFLGADYEYWARAAWNGLVLRQSTHYLINYIVSPKSAVFKYKTQLAYERWKLARKYGATGDQLYAGLIFLPQQVFVSLCQRLLPESLMLTLRRFVWWCKNRLVRETA